MVSTTLLVVSVWLVIEPCWKFGTTGTDFAIGVSSPLIAPRINPKLIVPCNLFIGI